MYAPQLGRWQSEDPLAKDPTLLHDNNWFGHRLDVMRNRYAYVTSNPINGSDPSGLVDPRSYGRPPAPRCGGQPYDPTTECCENGGAVAKAPIWRCKRYANLGVVGYVIWHHYLCCDGPNENCFGFVPGTKAGDAIRPEQQKRGTCEQRMVCPSLKASKCDSPTATCDYGHGMVCWG
jgi:RHS repeat-associated protein